MIPGNIPGDGRENPKPVPPAKRGMDRLSNLNFVKGTRIRVTQDNGRTGLVGLTGVVVQSFPGAVVVELDDDPVTRFRIRMEGFGFSKQTGKPKRHFYVTEVARIS